MDFFLPLSFTFLIGIGGLLAVLFLFSKWKLLDFPHRYGLKREPIPYPAGIAVVIGFIASLLLFFPSISTQLLGFLGALILLGTVSFIDDRKNIPPLPRFIVQILAAGIIVCSGTYIEYIRNPFSTESLQLPFIIGAIISVLWIMGFINVSNWIDGVPNVMIGTGFVSSMVIGVLSIRVEQNETALLCFLLAVILFPFIFGNIGKTRFLLGDTGAMCIGLCIAVFSIFSGGKMATAFIVMALPILDGIYVVAQRILEKKSPLKGGDGKHLHDILLKRNWHQWHIFMLYTTVSSGLGIAFLFLESKEKIFLIFFSTLLFFLLRYAESKKNYNSQKNF